MKTYLAIDIGGSKIIAGIVDETGKLLEFKRKNFAAAYTKEELLSTVFELCGGLCTYQYTACGVSIPGLADSKNGLWLYSPFLDIGSFDVAKILKEKLGVPVYIQNDVNCSALCERMFGHCKETDDFMWITLSNGVGGALFLNGKLYEGKHFAAGEIGHICVEENGERCCCGNLGCLETVASGRAISGKYLRTTGAICSAQELAGKAACGDPEAINAFARAGKGLGKAISYAVNLLDIDYFVIGGGVAQNLQLLLPSLYAALNASIMKKSKNNIKIEYAGQGYYSALIGCAALAIEKGE